MQNQPLVSICCITYNHEKYIREAIEGFLRQKTSFPIEVLLHDDASNDGTSSIIRAYESKYPDLIFPIYQKENQYSKGVKISPTYNWPRARGKYIALCEGDDYWTDPLKLQKQVDFLEKNEEYSMCAHDVKTIYEDDWKEKKNHRFNKPIDNATFEDLVDHHF
ncbi:MAG: glycosyltransferase family 2 protein, partial [Bacteroidota bacterium]